MSRTKINIGLFGFGCVGYGLYQVLNSTPNLKSSINKICIKDKNKLRPIESEKFTYNKYELLDNDEINTIVELIDDADEAFEIVKYAMKKGKAVVTANKKMIAENFKELIQLQQKFNVPLLYEAACCASIPNIRNLEEYYDNELLESIEGIVNGSTNYILTKTVQENISYQVALKDAQEKGFVESNPILDTGGFDAKYKLLILIAHAFGKVLKPKEILNIGIDNIEQVDLNYAKEKAYKIKLVAYASKTKAGKIVSFVLPKFVSSKDKLYSVDDVFNGIKTKSSFSDTQFFVGKGAGALPTASAVLSDISALSYNYKYEYKKLNEDEVSINTTDISLKIFFRFNYDNFKSYKKYFNQIDEWYQCKDHSIILGSIKLNNIIKVYKKSNHQASIILFNTE